MKILANTRNTGLIEYGDIRPILKYPELSAQFVKQLEDKEADFVDALQDYMGYAFRSPVEFDIMGIDVSYGKNITYYTVHYQIIYGDDVLRREIECKYDERNGYLQIVSF